MNISNRTISLLIMIWNFIVFIRYHQFTLNQPSKDIKAELSLISFNRNKTIYTMYVLLHAKTDHITLKYLLVCSPVLHYTPQDCK